MSGTTVSGTHLTGVTITSANYDPVSVASGATLSSTSAAGLYLSASPVWTVTNAGTLESTAKYGIGVQLKGAGTFTNQASADVSGYNGVKIAGGYVSNASGATITGSTLGVYFTQSGSAVNAGQMTAPGKFNTYAMAVVGTGSVTNVSGGTISSGNVGVILTGAGDVTNSGSIASTASYGYRDANNKRYSYGDRAGIDLRKGGSITNLEGGHITSLWKGVAIGYRPNSGTISPTITGTVTNSGYIFADDPTSGAGAAVWIHTPGVVMNTAQGTITGGPYGVVAYYDTTVVNSGTISGSEFAVFQSNTAASDLVEVAPGAVFGGLVEGTNTAASATGTLELLAGASAGSVTGFGSQYVGFSSVQIDSGATWSLAGTVTAAQTLRFAGTGELTLTNPAAMQGTIGGFVTGDRLMLAGITGATSATIDAGDQIVVSGTAGALATLQLDPSRHDPAGSTVWFQSTGSGTVLIACFAEGTRIATETGDIPVEALAPGMRARSPFGGSREIVWTGHRRTECRRHPAPHDVQPVRVQAGAFGPGTPAQDLWLSPDHAVFVSGVLIPVRYLINGRSIAQMDVDHVTYWHVELERHDVLLANGLPCESYLDTGNRGAFSGNGPVTMLHPDFALRIWDAQACAKLVRGGAELARVRQSLLDRAAELGHALTSDSGLTLWSAGRVLPVACDGPRYRVAAPAGPLHAVSRIWVPAHSRADASDMRRLGVALTDIRIGGVPVPLDHPGLTDGWQPAEPEWRWTCGAGRLELAEAAIVDFTLAMTGTYWQDGGAEAYSLADGPAGSVAVSSAAG